MIARESARIDLNYLAESSVRSASLVVRDVRLDSRQIKPGDAFIAVNGRNSHGLRHVPSAVAHGATVVIYDPSEGTVELSSDDVTLLPVTGLADRLSEISNRVYDSPSSKLEVVGITGTNGKTTCAWLYAMCRDEKAAYLGTLGAGTPPNLTATTHTTGDVFTVQRTLAEFVQKGALYAGIEVSSHALDQGRVDPVQIPIVAFTNLTRDHLDYHGTMQAYASAKERIFHCRGVRTAVVNIDDPVGREMFDRIPRHIHKLPISLRGRDAGAELFVAAELIECRADGLRIVGRSHAGTFDISTRLVGEFNAENVLVVLGLLLASRMPLDEACRALGKASPPPGRMESFSDGGALLVVDYAHTPDALEKALTALRKHVRGKLYCIFGCGGDRDPGKRPIMGQVAAACADEVILTDDNPRTEDPEKIIQMILEGISGQSSVHIERDRGSAICLAAKRAQAGDVVLIAGKGHEEYQIYGAESRQFSDRAIASSLARCAA